MGVPVVQAIVPELESVQERTVGVSVGIPAL